MTSATFFPRRWPTSTFGPGLHNLEIHSAQSFSARGWSSTQNAIFLQSLYAGSPFADTGARSFFHYNGNVYILSYSSPLLCFLDEVEAKYKEVTVVEVWKYGSRIIGAMVVKGRCEEELVPGSQDRGDAAQFAWAFRWGFRRWVRTEAERVYECLMPEVD
jgi:hypothetical protein